MRDLQVTCFICTGIQKKVRSPCVGIPIVTVTVGSRWDVRRVAFRTRSPCDSWKTVYPRWYGISLRLVVHSMEDGHSLWWGIDLGGKRAGSQISLESWIGARGTNDERSRWKAGRCRESFDTLACNTSCVVGCQPATT